MIIACRRETRGQRQQYRISDAFDTFDRLQPARPPHPHLIAVYQEAGTLSTPDGLTLATRCWKRDSPSQAAVVVVHGLSEHSGRYSRLAARLTQHDFAVYSYDHRYHGRSPGLPRGLLSDFDRLVADFDLVLAWVRSDVEHRPTFLLGHSLGGAVIARYVMDHGMAGLAGMVLSSAALRIPDDAYPVLRRFAPLLSRVVPRLPIGARESSLLSRDPAVRRAWKRDPLTYKGRLRARTGQVVLKHASAILENARGLTLPLLVMHGTADRITDPEGSRLLYEAAPGGDKTLKLYDGFYHELFNELGTDLVIDDLIAWLEERIPADGDAGAEGR